MKRSSWMALGAAGIVLAASTAFYLSVVNRTAPALTTRVVAGLIEKGKQALDRGDVDGIMQLMTPDARVIGRRPESIRNLIRKALNEVQTPLQAKTGRITLKSEGGEHIATFDLEIGQETGEMKAVYFPSLRVRLHLQRVRTPQWLGLYTVEEWRIAQFDCEPTIDTTFGG